MSDLNFIKNVHYNKQKRLDKNLKFILIFFVILIALMLAVNIWQAYKLYTLNNDITVAAKEVEKLDAVSKENNALKLDIKNLQQKILESQNILKANNKVVDLVIGISNLIPEDAYLDTFAFKPVVKTGLEKEYGLGKIKLKGFSNSRSITEFLERLSRLETVDNVKLIYLKYPDAGFANGYAGQETYKSNLLEFSIKLNLGE